MKRWDAARDGAIYQDILALENPTLSIYALESFAIIVDQQEQNDLLRNLVLSHAEIARDLEETYNRLSESEKLLSEAQQIANIGRWDYDMRTGEYVWSDSFRSILQFSPDDTPNLDLFLQRILPEDRDHIMNNMQRLLNEQESWTDRYRVILPDGTIRWVHVRLHTMFDQSGTPIKSYGTLQDITAMKEVEEALERYSKHLEEMVSDKVKEISESQMATIFALVKLAESRDDDTGAHIERTASYCSLLAEKARTLPKYENYITDEYITSIYRASPLHDIGKVGISDLILLKPGKLTPAEFAVMKTHVEIGYQTLKNIDKKYQNNAFVQMGLDITRYHHEKWDGSGYLSQLKGEQIPLSARIMALADVYDALRSKRVYKPAYTHEKAVEIIQEGRGNHFDPELVDLFLESHLEFKELFEQFG
ncbi:MAG: PAS domain-containing protein [Eubacteriales bacterium]